MLLPVVYRNAQGVTTSNELRISLPRFLKSAATTGLYRPGILDGFLRGIGYFLHRWEYFAWEIDYGFTFMPPPTRYYDPTTMGQFSNEVGKAIGDICARHFSGARYTHNYEAAMLARKLPIRGRRPDLYCDTGNRQFALEAKGLQNHRISDALMRKYKNQARSGPLPVHFSVASVTYDIYRHIRTNYFDPEEPNAVYDVELNRYLRRNYYSVIWDYCLELPQYAPLEENGGSYLRFALRLEDRTAIRLLVDRRIQRLLETNESEIDAAVSSERYFESEDNRTFIDADGIGIELN